MATTTNYNFTKPDVEGSIGTWGTQLNGTLDDIDDTVKSVSDVAAAALPIAGGDLTGNLGVQTATLVFSDKGTPAGAGLALDLSAGQCFAFTVGGVLALSFTNVPDGSVVTAVLLKITNGANSITWPFPTKWAGGIAPVLSAAGVDLVGLLTFDNGASWYGVVLAQDVR